MEGSCLPDISGDDPPVPRPSIRLLGWPGRRCGIMGKVLVPLSCVSLGDAYVTGLHEGELTYALASS